MPYSMDKREDLPEAVQKLPEAKQELWIKVWNDAFQRCKDGDGENCEPRAFAQANGVAMKESAGDVLAEAATLKAKALALVRDMAALLEDRTLPEAVRKEIEDVRTALRRTWADLEADGGKAEEADGETSTEAATPPEQEATTTETFAESAEGITLLSEGALPADGMGPLTLKVKLIEPGFGNKRDGHYYPAEMLRRDSHVFEGAKMFETDHREGEKSTRTWVSTVRKVTGYSDTGAPIAEVVVHDPSFAQRVRNLATSSLLDSMACSILASGNVKRGKVGGEDARIVEAITDAQAVDWVTRAGAGGQALAIMSEAQSEPEPTNGGTAMNEVEQQEPAVTPEPVQEKEPEPVVERLSETDAAAVLAEAQCNDAIKERLAQGSYANADALRAAIVAEVEYLKRVTGAGKVTDLGETAKAQPKKVTLAEVEDRVQKVNQKWGFGPARKPETKEK